MAIFSVIMAPIGEGENGGGVATYTGHADSAVEAVNRYVMAEVKNRFTHIRAFGSRKLPFMREFVRVEIPSYAPGSGKKLFGQLPVTVRLESL